MRSALLIVAVVLVAASPAVAQQDLRSPDTRDAAARFAERTVTTPGFPAYPTAAQPGEFRQDLRSPDTRDFAAGRGTFSAPDVTVVRVPEPVPAPARGIDWGDAGIGAAFMLVLAAAGTVAVLHRGRAHSQTAISR
jgi:Ni/Co efflux regulator RcnB